jgi:CubicO group peptidase (beta-lactamase class C family)
MHHVRPAIGLFIVGVLAVAQAATALPRSTPEAQGIRSAAVLDLVRTLDQQVEGMHSLMVLRHGQVIAEGWWAPYRPDDNHVLYSLSKSFTSTAIGLAVAEGRLSIDDEVMRFFPEEAPADASDNLKAMRVRDFLSMATGHQDEPSAAPEVISARSFLAAPVPHLPGTHFKYNTAATFMQSAILQQVTGQTLLDYLRPRLFEPLGIETPVWDANFQGVSLGGYGLRVRTEDIARFGQLYLQKGFWNGRQLLPAEWVEMATARQVSNGSNPRSDWNQGYGFQFWRCRHNAYRGDGAFGQFCVVMPGQRAVIAITGGVRDLQAVLDVIWDKWLPACEPTTLDADPAGMDALKEALASLELARPKGNATSALAAKVWNRRFTFPANDQKIESLAVNSNDGGQTLTLSLRTDGSDLNLPAAFGQWQTGRAALPGGRLATFPDEPVAGSFAWESDDLLAIKVCATETPFNLRYRLKFEGQQVTFDSALNVAFGPTKRPTLVGHAD